MSGVLFDALLPDFSIPGRATGVKPTEVFEPLVHRNPGQPPVFEPLSPAHKVAGAGPAATKGDYRLPLNVGRSRTEIAAPASSHRTEKENRLDVAWETVEKLQAEHAAALASLNDAHSAEIAALHEANATANARMIHASLETSQKTLSEALERHLLAILGPILTQKHQRASIEKLSGDAVALLDDPAISRLNVSGPSALLESFRAAVGDKIGRCVLTPSESLELQLTIDESVMSTRFGEWQAELERVAYE
jgi:hypothetical protein